jgi:tetratricopeptide (TPR) repeat protein
MFVVAGFTAIIVSVALSQGHGADCEKCDRARSLQEAGRCEDALPLLKKAIKENKKSIDALGLQVICYTELDKRKQAAKSLESFFELGPSIDDIRSMRSAIAHAGSPTPKVKMFFNVPKGADSPVLLLFHRPVPSQEVQEFRGYGNVLIEGVLRADGKLDELKEVRSGDWSHQEAFRYGESAIRSMNGWSYFPVLKDGKPIAVEFKAIVRIGP